MDIHILCDGEQIGPCTEAAVREMLKDGSVSPTDFAWTAGREDWEPLASLLPNRPEAPAAEPATPRQRAFLAYMGLPFAAETTRDEAARLVNDAMENPRDAGRLSRWSEERLLLHPELFAAEIQERKENRAQRYLEIYAEQGTPYFDKVTKAHCQVIVGYLDVHSPLWDANESEAAWKYFFPALAEKFPQLASSEGKQKFGRRGRQEEETRPARSSTPLRTQSPPSTSGQTFKALARGIFFGLLVLGVLWGGLKAYEKAAPFVVNFYKSTAAAVAEATAPKPETAPAEPAVETPAAEVPKATADATAAPTEEKPGMTAAAGDTPAASEAPAVAPPVVAPAPPPPRTSVILTKPMEITLAYGKITVPAGTSVKIVARNGVVLTVRYLDRDFIVPASATDLGNEATAVTQPMPSTAVANATAPMRE